MAGLPTAEEAEKLTSKKLALIIIALKLTSY
jgi:hypothetical protein